MVYKRYIKRGDKLFGPYYYKSYRDENGKTRTKLVKAPQENKFSAKLPYLVVFLLVLITGFFILNSSFEKTFNINSLLIKENPAKISIGESKIIGNIVKFIGFDVENEQETSE